MELSVARELFKRTDGELSEQVKKYSLGMRYYLNQNDIIQKKKEENDDDPLRNADNRVSSNFHQILVDQKASYLASEVPVVDLGEETSNTRLLDILGDQWQKVLQRLIIDASNAGISWLQVWHDEDTNKIKYAVVPSSQITPIYNNGLEQRLIAVRRTYQSIADDGKTYIYDEYWTDTEVVYYKREKDADYDHLVEDTRVEVVLDSVLGEYELASTAKHGFAKVPFIYFKNNPFQTSDLIKYKGLIDAYDVVFNGFINDLEDLQEVILILKGYEGEELQEFRHKLKTHKAIKVASGDGENGGVDKLTIDIPVEARNTFLDRTSDDIFTKGQGVNPTKVELGNNSGVAIKMLYTMLELKASALETEFRTSINQLIRLLLDKDDLKISQTWRRASISNEQEMADVVAKLADVTSAENIAKANPIVNDWQEEIKLREVAPDSFERDGEE